MDSLVVPKFQILDLNGDPLNGGKVWTYESGTTTPKITYSDRALSVANANPVILDTRGECAIFCSGLIKIYVTDSVDVAVYPAPLDNLRVSEPGALFDTDGDTGVEVEASPDEDKIRMQTAGTERLVVDYLGVKPAVGHGVCDADGDTQVYVEKTTDEDHVRIDAAGSEILSINASGLSFSTGSRVSAISNDTTMAANSPTLLSTQQGVKTYVDTISPIPSGTDMWFFTSSTVTGWTIIPTVDMVLYSESPGVPAGFNRPGGSWTISGLSANAHTHTGPSHTHTVAHDHGGATGNNSPASAAVAAGGAAWAAPTHSHTIPSQTPTSSSNGTGATSAASVNGISSSGAWRPAGYVNTLQRKN